jgi:catechol 2,3-dioxygenase-like lactoylglutathione lyase family enzyme
MTALRARERVDDMILGIEQITYGAGDLDTCRRFFADWGLALVDDQGEREGRLVFESLNGCRVVVADPARVALPAPIEDGPTLREVTWGVRDAASLADLRARLAGTKGFDDDSDSIGAVDPNGLAIRFRISTKRSIAVEGARSNTWDRHDRIDQAAPIYERATPVEVGHVVFFVADVAAAEAFYANLGFVTSDRYPGRGAFMRCDARGGHHDLFLLSAPDGKRGLNHVAFTVRDIHEVFGGGLAFSARGHVTQLGPGRHPISSAYFWYFKNPAGGLIEYYADEDQLTEAWQPRDFEPGPTVFAEWAIDGGIDGRTRRQKGHEAGGKFLTEKRH